MYCPNGIRKFDIFHKAFQSFLLVRYSITIFKGKTKKNRLFCCKHIQKSEFVLTKDLSFLYILGTKLDLRVPNSERFVTLAEGKKMKNKIHAFALVECSARRKVNLADVFHEAVRAVSKKPYKKRNACLIL